jgi:hypothetical protein
MAGDAMPTNLTGFLGHARAADRQGHGRKVRHGLKSSIKRLTAKLAAEADPQRRERLAALLERDKARLAAIPKPSASTWVDPRKTFFHPNG